MPENGQQGNPTELIYSERQGGVFSNLVETGVRTWKDMDSLPAPVPGKSPREVVARDALNLPA